MYLNDIYLMIFNDCISEEIKQKLSYIQDLNIKKCL